VKKQESEGKLQALFNATKCAPTKQLAPNLASDVLRSLRSGESEVGGEQLWRVWLRGIAYTGTVATVVCLYAVFSHGVLLVQDIEAAFELITIVSV